MTITFTDEQREIIEHIRDSEKSLIGEARAGTSKTTTSVAAIGEVDPTSPVVACAFNRRIADELADKMPGNATCKTLNGLGHGALYKGLNKLNLDRNKNFRVLDAIQVDRTDCPDLMRLISLGKANGIVPGGEVEGLVPDTDANWQDIVDDHALDVSPYYIDKAREGLRVSTRMALRMGVIDFDDQVYLSALWDQFPLPMPDIVLVDEAQDISPVNRAQLRKMTQFGKLVAMGDRYQAIYAFRGADSQSIPMIQKEWDADVLPLTTSFRCPSSVVMEAKHYVSDIQPWVEAEKGVVEHLEEIPFDHTLFERGDVILCRNTRPLVSLVFPLIKMGVPATIMGRDIGAGLVALVKKQKGTTVPAIMGGILEFEASKRAYLLQREKEEAAEHLHDQVQCLEILAGQCRPGDNKQKLIDCIDRLFSDGKSPVTLSTVHKAKGFEWPRVFFLDRDLIPSRWAKTPEQLQQERNIAYVAITRAQKSLHYISSLDFDRGDDNSSYEGKLDTGEDDHFLKNL